MSRNRTVAAYVLLVGLPVVMLAAVLHFGANLRPADLPVSPPAAVTEPAQGSMNVSLLVLQVAVVLLASRLTGMIFRKFRQPQVVGEMLAGILLGPSLLGWAAPGLSQLLFPPSSLGYFGALSQIGLVFFMFLVGVSLDPRVLREHGRAALLTSHASIVAPFCLGSALALFLYPRLSQAGVSFTNFALFMGSAMSITAFPVLARILTEYGLLHSRVGTLAISCAAVDDITGWCILAYIVTLTRSGNSQVPLAVTLGGIAVYLTVMLLGVKRVAPRFEISRQARGDLTENALSLMIVMALASAWATERLGIHAVFGAFFMGAIMPKSPGFIQAVLHKLEPLTMVGLLPLFFAFSGLRTSIGSLHGHLWLYALLVMAVAIAGKFGGSMLAARMTGVTWRDSASLGILMNTRGLMELIALNIGLDIGVISPTVFTILMLMALATTFMTSPLLEWVNPGLVQADTTVP